MTVGRAGIAARFGTWRGLCRLALSYIQILTVKKTDPARAKRLVFVCHGNICRSAFADAVARQSGLDTASFGLSTASGKPAHAPVIAAARSMGVDLDYHRSVAIEDFEPRAGDLYLVMEVRQITKLRSIKGYAHADIDLIGRWIDMPHIHDPYQLSKAYVATSLRRLKRAVDRMIAP